VYNFNIVPYIHIILIGVVLGLSGGAAYGISNNALAYTASESAAVEISSVGQGDIAPAAVGPIPETSAEAVLESSEEAALPPTETTAEIQIKKTAGNSKIAGVPDVPFYSQFNDISAAGWQKLGCGIASLAMLIEYYEPGIVSVDTLLDEGISSGAYLSGAGWIHYGLVRLSNNYGLDGKNYDFSSSGMDFAFEKLKDALNNGPIIASVHYTFEPTNPIPHLVVINGIDGDTVYYNDPSEGSGGGSISASKFKSAWKKRYIEVRPYI